MTVRSVIFSSGRNTDAIRRLRSLGVLSVMAMLRQLSDAQADPSAILPETVRVHVSPHCGNRLIT
jgi:hypothetical protein